MTGAAPTPERSTRAGGADRPHDFRYWENLDTPWARRARWFARRALGFDLAPDVEKVAAFSASYFEGDPLAEAFVADAGLGPGQGHAHARALLDRALAEGIDALEAPPASLRRLTEDLTVEPDWLDWELCELGAKAFRRFGTAVFRFAGTITLEAYAESSVAKPLALTGAYSGKSARRRFLETASFWVDVSEPGALRPGAPGFAAAVRVRIMHVYVRARLASHAEWDTAAWGVPISQGDALLTLMGGSFAPGIAMHAMGYRTSRREIEALMHFWRYVGHLMGVRPRWYPADLREAAQLSFVAFLKSSRTAGEDGRRLCQSYVDAFSPEPGASLVTRLRGSIQDGIHRGYTRYFLTSRSYRHNALPSAGLWALYPAARAPLILFAETLRRRVPRVDDALDRAARARRRRWLDEQLGHERAEFRPVERFTR